MQTGLLRHSVVTADAPSFPSFFVFPLALVPLFERNSHRFRRLGNDYDRLKTLTHMQNSVNSHLSRLPIHCTINQSPKEETILGCRSSGDRKLGSPHTRSSAAADQSFEVYKCATSATHDVWEKWTWRRCSCSAMSITDMAGRLNVVAVFFKNNCVAFSTCHLFTGESIHHWGKCLPDVCFEILVFFTAHEDMRVLTQIICPSTSSQNQPSISHCTSSLHARWFDSAVRHWNCTLIWWQICLWSLSDVLHCW